jgi:hypothetical protein
MSYGLYLPYVLDGYTFPVLRDLFANKYKIGIIRHVDYVYSKHKTTESGKPVRSAFVHFEKWFDNDFVRYLKTQLETEGKYNLAHYIVYLEMFRNERNHHCMSCATSIDLQIKSMKNYIDDILLLIQRPKPSNKEMVDEMPLKASPKTTTEHHTLEDIRVLLEKHERRIELLEDEIRALISSRNMN